MVCVCVCGHVSHEMCVGVFASMSVVYAVYVCLCVCVCVCVCMCVKRGRAALKNCCG